MIVDVIEPDWYRFVDQQSQHAKALRQGANLLPGALVDAFINELDEFMVGSTDTQRPVTGVNQLECGVHDGAKGGVEF